MSLRDFISLKKAALVAELRPLEARLASIRLEFAEIEAVESSIGSDDGTQPDVLHPALLWSDYQPSNGVLKERVIQEFVLRVLAESPHGMTATDLRDALSNRFAVDYPRTSLSPQLSRMKSRGLLGRRGFLWSITSDGRNRLSLAP